MITKSNIIKNILYPFADLIMSTKVISYYKLIRTMQNWTKEEISEWQDKKLKELVKHAYNNTKYYKKLFDKNKLRPDIIKKKEDLKLIPILTKNDIRLNYFDLCANNINRNSFIYSSTGGSTGAPLKYLLDKKSWSFTNANNLINWEKHGYKIGEKFLALGSTSLFINTKISLKHFLYYKFKSKIGVNGINMSDSVCESYINFILKNNIKYLYGYSTSIYLLARYVLKNHVQLNLIACFSTSEILTTTYRETIIKAFNSVVLNCYGARDGGITAFENNKNKFEVGYNSLLNIDPQKNLQKVIITDLFNYAMPLINYDVGDEIIIDNEVFNCIYNGQVFKDIVGRSSKILKFSNGNIITGPGFTILFKDLPVDYYCLKQNSENSVTVIIHKLADYTVKDEIFILDTIKKQIGNNIEIKIDYESPIIYTQNGKKEYLVSSNFL